MVEYEPVSEAMAGVNCMWPSFAERLQVFR